MTGVGTLGKRLSTPSNLMIEHRFNPWPLDPAKAEQQARYAVRRAYYREHYQRNRETILRKANLRHARKRAGITPEIEATRILFVLLALGESVLNHDDAAR